MNRLLLCLLLCACGRDVAMPTDPAHFTVPANAVRFTPTNFEASALDSVRACILTTGHTVSPLAVTDLAWYTVPGPLLKFNSGRRPRCADHSGHSADHRDYKQTTSAVR